MKFKDRIKSKEYKQAKVAVKECLSRNNEWKKTDGEGWITDRTYRVRRNKEEKLLPSIAFLTPHPPVLNPQPSILKAPALPQALNFTVTYKPPSVQSPISPVASSQETPLSPTFTSSTKETAGPIPIEGMTSEPFEVYLSAEGNVNYFQETKNNVEMNFNSQMNFSQMELNYQVKLSSDVTPSDLLTPTPTSLQPPSSSSPSPSSSEIPITGIFPKMDTSKEEIEQQIVYKFEEIEEEEEIEWDAVRVLVEANGTSFYGLGEIAGSLQLNDLCDEGEEEDDEEEKVRNPAENPHGESGEEFTYKVKQKYKQSKSRKAKKGMTICWNTDVGLYSQLNPSLYQSHPFLISILRDGSARAYYLDSTYLSIVHLSKLTLSEEERAQMIADHTLVHEARPFEAGLRHSAHFVPPADPPLEEGPKEYYQLLFISRSKSSPPLYIMHAKSPQEIAQEITRLFGSIALPPKWAVGYHQCRYSYYPDTRVVSIAEAFRHYKIPCDVIWMDIHYMDEYRCFRFSPRHFPDPAKLSHTLHSMGYRGVWMIDPGIKVDENYEVFQSGLLGDHFILRQSPKDTHELEHFEIDQHDQPPPLQDYPEIKEANNLQDVVEEPGFNRAPDLGDTYSDLEDNVILDDDDDRDHQICVEDALDDQLMAELAISEKQDRDALLASQEAEEVDECEMRVVIQPKRIRSLDELEIGKVWPGDCVFPDFTRRETRKWWACLYSSFLLHNGVDGVWNDMNEVASFGEGGTIHRKSWHRADREIGGWDDHSRYHNVYGFYMTLATKQGMRHARKDKREFVLTRANFMGGHRHAATWTGDNTSNWDHLGWTIPMTLNLSLSGQLFCGADIGGFFGDATPELYARWMGFGALLPFARAHSCVRTRNHEPWSFGKDVKRICKGAIERRYKLLGYYYTLFYEASAVTSLPILQPLFYQSPADLRLRDVDSIFTIGSSILVVADLTPTATPSPPEPSSPISSPTTSIIDLTLPDQAIPISITTDQPDMEKPLDSANPLNDDEDIPHPVEHLAEDTAEEEEARRKAHLSNQPPDRFPDDLLSRSDWIRFHVLDDFSDQYESELPELYLKRGAAVPLIALHQHVLASSEYFLQPLSFHFAFQQLSPSLFIAEGNLYEDDGENFDYATLHSYVKFRIEKSIVTPDHPHHPPHHHHHHHEEQEESGQSTITVYMIHLTPQSSHTLFDCDRVIHLTEITHENAHHPLPLFHFHQSLFEESTHPAYPSSKVFAYVHSLEKLSSPSSSSSVQSE